MAKKLLTFLGTGDYVEVYHSYNDNKEGPHSFIQESLVEFFCKDWSDKDSVVVIMTSVSRNKNWYCRDGLKKKLDDLKKTLNLNVQVVPLEIPEGKEENELWTIFTTIFESINEGDEIILDVTHSFRSLPILSLIILNYAKTVRQIKIEKILYAAFEVLGSPKDIIDMPLENRKVPIFNLTPFVTLFDWTIAVDRFLETGNAGKIRELSSEELKSVLRETKGKAGGNVRRLTENLAKFTEVIYTCRGPEITESIKTVQKNVKSIDENESDLIIPFKYLIDKIDQKFSSFDTSNDINSNLDAVEWCLENNLIQQGITMLRETIVNYVIEKYVLERQADGDELRDKEIREKAEDLINEIALKIYNEETKIDEIKDNAQKEIAKLWMTLGDYRNDIDHAGWREQIHHDFQDKLKDFVNETEKIIRGI